MAGQLSQLKDMLAPVVESLDCELWGLELRQNGRETLLRIFIEKEEGGIGVADCEKVSRQVSSILDVEDPISGEYTLEVSSPGMDRPLFTLEQFARYIGEKVSVRLRIAFDGRKNFTGVLTGVEEDDVVVRVDNEEFLLPHDAIDKAHVIPTFSS